MNRWIVLGICVFVIFQLNAQPKDGTPNTPAPFGGLELLLMAGAVLGGKKACDRFRNSG